MYDIEVYFFLSKLLIFFRFHFDKRGKLTVLVKKTDLRARLPVLKSQICPITNFVTLGEPLTHKRRRRMLLFIVSYLVKSKWIYMNICTCKTILDFRVTVCVLWILPRNKFSKVCKFKLYVTLGNGEHTIQKNKMTVSWVLISYLYESLWDQD